MLFRWTDPSLYLDIIFYFTTRIVTVSELKEFQRFEQKHFVRERKVFRTLSFSDEGSLLETLEFFEISHGSYQPFNFLPLLSFITVYTALYFYCPLLLLYVCGNGGVSTCS